MNKAEIRTAARTITELTEADVSNSTLDLYIKDGYDRIISLERRWPFFETSTTLATVAGQRDYTLSVIGSGNWREVTSIVNDIPGGRLQLVSYDHAEEVFLTGWDYVSQPRWWSVWQDTIQIWPRPDAVYSLRLRGYRKPNDWHLSESTEVDADLQFHRPLVYYAVAQLYQLQEDVEMASFYRQTFDEAVRLAHQDVMRVPQHVPLILSGGHSSRFAGPLRDGLWWVQ